jgi:cystathionine beta-lyase
MPSVVKEIAPSELDRLLVSAVELAVFDVRERRLFAREHLLLSSCLPLSVLELDVDRLAPRPTVPTVLIDDDPREGRARLAAERLASLGRYDVAVLEGGLRAMGRELFSGVGSLCKAFGE